MKPTQIILGAIIGGLIIFLLFGKAKPTTNTIIQSDTITIHDTIHDSVHVTKWKIKEVIQPKDTFFVEYDSTQLLEIARKYYSVNFFDTLVKGADCEIQFNTLVSKNKPYNSLFTITNTRATQLITNNTIATHPKIYFGANLQGSASSLDVFGVVGYQKGKYFYMGAFSPFTKSVSIGIMRGIN
jgi:hypothetical protein